MENTQIPKVSSTTIAGIQTQFINTILPTETSYFGSPPAGDFTILIMDIQDGGGSTFVAGYFDPRNEFLNSSLVDDHSNERHMIYMDSNPGRQEPQRSMERLPTSSNTSSITAKTHKKPPGSTKAFPASPVLSAGMATQ